MKKRNYGIDLLRLVAMYMVVILHVLGNGGVLSATSGLKNSVAWLLEIAAYCAVNCYAIISGYVCYSDQNKEYHYEKILHFWLQVIVYSLGITLIAFWVRPEKVSIGLIIRSTFPIASKQYWYVSAYVGLFFIIPWLNKLIRSCNKKEISRLIFIISTVFIIYMTFANIFSVDSANAKIGDAFSFENGYSFSWLTILYVVGAWMKKCDIPHKMKNRDLFIGMGSNILITWLFLILNLPAGFSKLFINYTSITIVYSAFALVAIFSKIQLRTMGSRVVSFFAPAAFGVYLIHVHPILWNVMTNKFIWIVELRGWIIPGVVCGIAFGIFAICIFIEKIRLILFDLLRINQLVDKIAIALRQMVENKLSFFYD